jgi:hypothetical protein
MRVDPFGAGRQRQVRRFYNSRPTQPGHQLTDCSRFAYLPRSYDNLNKRHFLSQGGLHFANQGSFNHVIALTANQPLVNFTQSLSKITQ